VANAAGSFPTKPRSSRGWTGHPWHRREQDAGALGAISARSSFFELFTSSPFDPAAMAAWNHDFLPNRTPTPLRGTKSFTSDMLDQGMSLKTSFEKALSLFEVSTALVAK